MLGRLVLEYARQHPCILRLVSSMATANLTRKQKLLCVSRRRAWQSARMQPSSIHACVHGISMSMHASRMAALHMALEASCFRTNGSHQSRCATHTTSPSHDTTTATALTAWAHHLALGLSTRWCRARPIRCRRPSQPEWLSRSLTGCSTRCVTMTLPTLYISSSSAVTVPSCFFSKIIPGASP